MLFENSKNKSKAVRYFVSRHCFLAYFRLILNLAGHPLLKQVIFLLYWSSISWDTTKIKRERERNNFYRKKLILITKMLTSRIVSIKMKNKLLFINDNKESKI
jgi:hypothetical protein